MEEAKLTKEQKDRILADYYKVVPAARSVDSAEYIVLVLLAMEDEYFKLSKLTQLLRFHKQMREIRKRGSKCDLIFDDDIARVLEIDGGKKATKTADRRAEQRRKALRVISRKGNIIHEKIQLKGVSGDR